MEISFEIIIPVLALISYSILFFVLAFSKPQTSARIYFRAYLFAMAVWSLAGTIVLLQLGNLLFWFRMMTTGALASMLALFLFSQAMLNQKYSFTPLVVIYGLVSISATQFTPFAIPTVAFENGSLQYEFSPFIGFIAGPGYLLMFFNAVKLWQAYKKSYDSIHKNRTRLLLMGIIIIILGSTVNFTDLGKYPIDITANLIAALLFTYAILRHNLLDITVVIRKSLLYAIPTMILGAGYFLIINFAINIFHIYTSLQLFSLSLIVAMMSALIMQPFKDLAQKWIDRLFFREHLDAVQMLQHVSTTASTEIDLHVLTQLILAEICRSMHVTHAAMFLKHNGHKRYALAAQTGALLAPRTVIVKDHPLVAWLESHNKVLSSQELEIIPNFKAMWVEEKEVLDKLGATLYVPLKSKGELTGFIALGEKMSEQIYSDEEKEILLTLSNQTAVAVQNAQLYTTARQELQQRREAEKMLQLQLKRLSALQNINIAITTNIDLQIPLYLLLEQVTEELKVDAADILLLNDEEDELYFVAGRGFKTDALKFTRLQTGEGLAGMAAETGKVIHINDLKNEETSLKQSPLIEQEGFICYYGVPLSTKGKTKGVLELFHRSPLNPDKEWLDYLDTLTSETAIAVDNAQLFKDLEKTNQDLAVAYETTLEGWAKTLELRDRETEGHSQRVMDLTLRLSKKLGINGDDIIHVQRGAILHDIGKMGIPDSILLKAGPLTKAEWEIMRKHPVYAHDMLSAIPFLQKAMDIPYCHHEKWDGSGYPNGLKGEDIPLSARIFALVDVWDALRSDRPYRKAWADEEALAYIKEQSGSHFDPLVVQAFFDLIELEKRLARQKKEN